MASSPITSWQIDGETVETVTDFILGGSKITADGGCSRTCWKMLAASLCFGFFAGKACRILASRPGIKPKPPALEGEILT